MLMRDDAVLAVSYGGETEEIVALLLPFLYPPEIIFLSITGRDSEHPR